MKIQLSPNEYAELRRTVNDGVFPNMALLVFQAIHEGLEGDEIVAVQRNRTRAVSVHVSEDFKEKIRMRARAYRVTQQALLRGLLFQYIRSKPWQRTQTETEGA